MSFKLIWPTRSRSGSQFVVKLTRSLFGSAIGKVALVNGARRDTTANAETIGSFSEMMVRGEVARYITDNGVGAMKYEDPGKDDGVLQILDAFPEAKAVASYRRVEDIISSHFNIHKWGHGEADVLHQFSACLPLYRELFRAGRLYMVNVDDKQGFSLAEFSSFLGRDETSVAREVVAAWEPTNTLEYQQGKHDGGEHGRQAPPRIERLREIHPWIGPLEQEYLSMCNRLA